MIMLGLKVLMAYQVFGILVFMKMKHYGWAGAPDIVAEYKGQIVLGDLKTSNNPYCSQWPDSSTPKNEYGKKDQGL